MTCETEVWQSERCTIVDASFAGLTPSFTKPADDSASVAARIGASGFVSLDAGAGAFIVWFRDSADGSEWRELRAGESYAVCGPNVLLAPSAFCPEYRARLLVTRSPLKPTIPAWHPFQTGETNVQVDMITQIAAGIAQGKPSAAGATVTASDSALRWATLDGRRGVRTAWVRMGGSGNYYPVSHGEPFPVDGANFEVRVHPACYGSLAVFMFSHRPKPLLSAPYSVYEASLAASTGALLNALVYPATPDPAVSTGKLNFKSAGVGTYSLEFVTDSGSGTAPSSTILAGAATDGSQQILNTAIATVPIVSIRLITFGGYVRAWVWNPT